MALRAGVNYIDTSTWYGHGKSEILLGKALRAVPRSAFFIATKCGRYAPDPEAMFDFSAERVAASVDESLQRLGLDYIDVMQVHDPEFAADWRQIVEETLPALEAARRAGKIKFIGMTGYPLDLQRKIIEAAWTERGIRVDISLTYCHFNLMDQSLVDDGFVAWAKARGLGVINASALGMRMFTPAGAAGVPKWHPANPHQKQVCAEACDAASAAGHNISKLATQFAMGCADVASLLISTASPDRMAQNLAWATAAVPDAERRFASDLSATMRSKLGDDVMWEGNEVKKYFAAVGQALLKRGAAKGAVAMNRSTLQYEAVEAPGVPSVDGRKRRRGWLLAGGAAAAVAFVAGLVAGSRGAPRR